MIVTAQSQPPNQGDKGDNINDLIRRYQENPADEEVQEVLLKKYRDLVNSLASKYSKGKSLHEDLFQVGMIGLLNALKRFDVTFGKSFESYAIPTIIGEMKRYIRDKTWSVHVPRRIKELGPKIKKAVDALTNELQRSPKVHEISSYLQVSEEEVLESMEMGKNYQALSVDNRVNADSENSHTTLLDLISDPEDRINLVDQRIFLENAFDVLTEREALIIKYTFFDNLSQQEAGNRLGISQMHVSRLQRKALIKLQEAMSSNSSSVT